MSTLDSTVNCSTCRACCCRLEVLLVGDSNVPQEYVSTDAWGGEVMQRLDDGWCVALDRATMRCTIYEYRPWICRQFEMGSDECVEQIQAVAT